MQKDRIVPVPLAAPPVTPGLRALAWGILSLSGFIASLLALVWLIGLMQLFGMPHVAALGVCAFAWVLGSGLLALAAARLAFGGWCEVRLGAWLVLLVGAFVSAGQIAVLADWTIARFGYSDPDFVGPTFLLFAVVAGVAVAAFGVQVAPRGAAWPPLLAALGGAALGAAIMLSNVPGLADGLGSDSVPLAGMMAAAAVYIGAVGILSFVHLRRG